MKLATSDLSIDYSWVLRLILDRLSRVQSSSISTGPMLSTSKAASQKKRSWSEMRPSPMHRFLTQPHRVLSQNQISIKLT